MNITNYCGQHLDDINKNAYYQEIGGGGVILNLKEADLGFLRLKIKFSSKTHFFKICILFIVLKFYS